MNMNNRRDGRGLVGQIYVMGNFGTVLFVVG